MKYQKRINAYFLIVLVTLTSISIISKNNDAWNIIISDAISYNLDISEWEISYDGNTISGSGGYFKGLLINEPSIFSVEVIEIDEEWGVVYQVDNATDSVNEYMTMDRFYFEFLRFLYYCIDESRRLVDLGLNESRIQKGPELIPWFFIDPIEETWEFLTNMSDINYHNSLPIVKNIQGNLRAGFERENSEASFDITIQGIVNNETENINLEFDHTLKFVWNSTTGILLGYRISSYFTGNLEGHTLSEQINVVCMQVNYDLARFRFLSGFIPGFTFIIAIVSLSIFGIIILINKKKGKW
ncbi:MAG: hypothetical protein FK731_04460 [Asgard group archaeon]|nr:hypothetical protein [Asgard group archaeon]